MDKYIGRLLDNRYEILEVIGSGGMAVVYKALCHRLNRMVAIKILKDDFLDDEDFRRRFHAESQAVAMLSHPNIVSVYDVSTSVTKESDYIVMELIEGITLKQYMEKKGVLNWKETLHFAIQIAKALEHAHSRGIVHRDIKPHNVMVLKNGSVKVADFGIARMMTGGDTLTKEALGSVHYISPEQAKGGRVDNRSDIYSLGVVMYEMMSGRPPYEGETPVSVAIQHINGGAVSPTTLNPNIPGGMEQIIMKAMAHDLADRYVSATHMLEDMDTFRKNPSALFDYHTPPTDAVTKFNPPPIVLHPENGTKKPGGEGKKDGKKPEPSKPKEKPVKKKQDRPVRSSEGSRVATVAILACSIVAIVAIVVFLVIWLGGAPEEKFVSVPNLIGKHEETLPMADYKAMGLQIKVSGEEYSDSFSMGQITRQEPAAGTEVSEGSTVWITVSKGQDPLIAEAGKMQNLVGKTLDEAKNQLNAKNLALNIIVEKEYSSMPENTVIATDPKDGSDLHRGQKITLLVSLGEKPADVKTVKMPSLTGRTYEDALAVLAANGLPEPVVEHVYHDTIAANRVVSQSVATKTVIDVTTVITIEVSDGPEPEPTEPEDPTEPDDPTEPEDPTEPTSPVETTPPVMLRMPPLTGKTYEDAIKVLSAYGFPMPNVEWEYSDTVERDLVISQSVEAATEIPNNTVITIVVSDGPEPPSNLPGDSAETPAEPVNRQKKKWELMGCVQ